MSHQAEIERRKKRAAQGGGAARQAARQAPGRLSARERIEFLLDDSSFEEWDQLIEHRATAFGLAHQRIPGDGVLGGVGRVEGRTVFVFAQDFTVFGGSLSEANAAKICKLMDAALRVGAPMIGLNDSGGARIQEGVAALAGYADIFLRNTLASGVIPQLSAILGPCAGAAVYSPAITDFIFMVERESHMFVTGPDVIAAVTHEQVDKEALGGADTHNRLSGVAHFQAADDRDCLRQMRALLGYLPSNNQEDPPRRAAADPAGREAPALETLVPAAGHQPYDVRAALRGVADDGELLEIQEHFAPNLVIGFARLAGRPVGMVANQPAHLAGVLDIDASDKGARFVRFCDAFNLPLITWVDVPGFLPGVQQELGGIIRHGAKLLFAYAEATVPKITVTLRKAYGGAYCVMASKHLRTDLNYAWPTAEIAVMGAEGAVRVLYRKELQALDEAARAAQEKARIEEYRAHFANPFVALERGYLDAVIAPRQTRQHLIRGLEWLQNKRAALPPKKHGNIPL